MHTNTAEQVDRPPTGPRGPWGPVEQVLRRQAARWWWAPLVGGVAWFLIAWLVLRADYTSLATVGVLVGVVLLVAAVNEAGLGSLMTRGWKLAHYVLSGVFVVGSAWAFVRPVDTFFALASMLGLLLFLQGALYIVLGIGLRGVSPYWGLQLFSGLLITALGLWVSVSDRVWDLAARSVFVLLWVGLMAIFRGISDIVLAFSMLGFGTAQDSAQQDSAGAGTAPSIPAQERRTPDGAPRPEVPTHQG